VPQLLRPLIEGELGGEARAEATRAAARHLYAAWWKGQEQPQMAQVAEVHRLALRAKERTIAVEAAEALVQALMRGEGHQNALTLLKKTLGQVPGDPRLLSLLADAEFHVGETGAARRHYEQALRACPETEATLELRSRILFGSGYLFAQQGQADLALKLWGQSLELDGLAGDDQGKAATMFQMACVFKQRGDLAEAMRLWNQSLELSERVHNDQGKAAALHEMAGMLKQQGYVDEAMRLWYQSLEIKERVGDLLGKAATLRDVAGVLAQQGLAERAMLLQYQALEIFERIGHAQGKAAVLHSMAGALAQQEQVDEAMRLWEQSLEIFERIGDVRGKAATLNRMALVLARRGCADKATELLNESLELHTLAGEIRGRALTIAFMASMARTAGDPARWLQLSREAAQLLASCQAWPQLVNILYKIGAGDGPSAQIFLLQACWLVLKGRSSVKDGIAVLSATFRWLGADHAQAPAIGVAGIELLRVRGGGDSRAEVWLETAHSHLAESARAHGIASEDVVGFQADMLRKGATTLASLMMALEAMVPEDGWLFDRTQFGGIIEASVFEGNGMGNE
jgi:tetratricopeptide (TPR) repeat protein